MYLVTGITGQVGAATARALLRQEKSVRALVRDPKKAAEWQPQGVELVEGDLSEAASRPTPKMQPTPR